MCIKKDILVIESVNKKICDMISHDVEYHEAKQQMIALLCELNTQLSIQFNFRFIAEIHNVNKSIASFIEKTTEDARHTLIEFEQSTWFELHSQVIEYA